VPAVISVDGRGARTALTAVARDLVYRGATLESSDPLGWSGYRDQLEAARSRSGEHESVVVADGEIAGRRVVLVAFDFDFLGGSIGEATGELILQAFTRARTRRQPVVSLVASGGARIQEGMRSLQQLQRVSAACTQARQVGVVHISVVRNPTTGGAWVALASNADVIVAVNRAEVSFAGSRVRAQDPAPPFVAEAKQQAGFVDVTVPAEGVPALLSGYIDLLGDAGADPEPAPVPEPFGLSDPTVDGWNAVQRARAGERPHSPAYLDRYFSERVTISGDRVGGRDDGMLCGFGRHDGRTIAYAAQTATRNSAAGFRTVTRLVRLADRLRLPILTIIDTPGADDTAAAERAGIGTAIGETFAAISEATVPVTSLLIGEGGSGGALALASTDRLWMTRNSYFSVMSPEGAATLLGGTVYELADRLQLGPREVVELGVAEGVLDGCSCAPRRS
jgi:acetyl-CoA carboxylase carboxyl transferase subunit beta